SIRFLRTVRGFEDRDDRKSLFQRHVDAACLEKSGRPTHQVGVETVIIGYFRPDIAVSDLRRERPSERFIAINRITYIHNRSAPTAVIQGHGSIHRGPCVGNTTNIRPHDSQSERAGMDSVSAPHTHPAHMPCGY